MSSPSASEMPDVVALSVSRTRALPAISGRPSAGVFARGAASTAFVDRAGQALGVAARRRSNADPHLQALALVGVRTAA